MRRTIRMAAGTALAAGGALAPGNPAAAAQPPPTEPVAAPVVAVVSTVSLPLLGAPVTVAVTTDAGGVLLDVSLSPTDALNAEPVPRSHVSFVNEDGTVKLHVATTWAGERVSARTGSPAETTAPGGSDDRRDDQDGEARDDDGGHDDDRSGPDEHGDGWAGSSRGR